MRPDYDGVKFYGKEDMGNAIQLKKADSIINGIKLKKINTIR